MTNMIEEIFIKEFIKIATNDYHIKYLDAERIAFQYYKHHTDDVIKHKNAILPIYVTQILDDYGIISHEDAIQSILKLARNNRIISN